MFNEIYNYLNSFVGYFLIAFLVTWIIIFIKKLRFHKKIEETSSIKLFFDIIGLISIIPLFYWAMSDGKFVLGTSANDLLIPIGVTIIFILIHIPKEIGKYLHT